MLGPDEATIGDALLNLMGGDLLTIQLIYNDGGYWHGDHMGGRSRATFLRTTVVVMLMRLCVRQGACSNNENGNGNKLHH